MAYEDEEETIEESEEENEEEPVEEASYGCEALDFGRYIPTAEDFRRAIGF